MKLNTFFAFTLAIGSLAVGASSANASISFVEDFNTTTLNANLAETNPGAFTLTGTNIRMTGTQGRQYMRTLNSDYTDFVYELTVNVSNDIAFIGVGRGLASPSFTNEPLDHSFTFRIHSPNIGVGQNDVAWGDASNTSNNVITSMSIRNTTTGPHRVRIERSGDLLTFGYDHAFNGTYAPEDTFTFDLSTRTDILNSLNAESHLFFGGQASSTSFDDLVVQSSVSAVPEPSSLVVASMLGCCFVGFRRRDRK